MAYFETLLWTCFKRLLTSHNLIITSLSRDTKSIEVVFSLSHTWLSSSLASNIESFTSAIDSDRDLAQNVRLHVWTEIFLDEKFEFLDWLGYRYLRLARLEF